MKTFNVCFLIYASEDIKARTQEEAKRKIKVKYSELSPDELSSNDFSTGDVEIDMLAERDKKGYLI